MEIVIQIGLLVIGFVMLMKGADWFVDGSAWAADKLGIPQLVIGLTIVAMGTSAPEAAVSISAALHGSADITIGNVLGSNILNILIILGITSVICTIPVQKSTVRYEIPFVIIVSVLLTVLGAVDGYISLLDGVILWAFMILYLIYLFRMSKKGETQTQIPETGEEEQPVKMVLLAIVGLVLIVWGSDVTVNAATNLAEIFKISPRIIGLTIVAFGTSLPELVTSVTAAVKGKADIAVGNIVGSNIFNILFVVGTTALITPVAYQSGFFIDSIVTIASAILLFVCVLRRKQLNRTGGVIMLLSYVAYFGYLIIK